MSNNYNLSEETLTKALLYMKQSGYVDKDETTEGLISYTRSMVEDIPFIVVAKIEQWASEYGDI